MELRHPVGINSKDFEHFWGAFSPKPGWTQPLLWPYTPALAWKALNIFSSETLLLLHQPHIFIYSSTIFSHSEMKSGFRVPPKKKKSYNTHHIIQAQLILLGLFSEESPAQQGRFWGNSASFEVSEDETEQLKNWGQDWTYSGHVGVGVQGGRGLWSPLVWSDKEYLMFVYSWPFLLLFCEAKHTTKSQVWG